ncbi:MAG: YhdP family protein [Acidiferrobacter sp.]
MMQASGADDRKTVGRLILRYGWRVAAVVFGIVAVALATSPLWLTPILQNQRAVLVARVAQGIGGPVRIQTIGAIVGWRPGFVMRGLVVGAASPAIEARALRARLSWRALLEGRVRLARLTLVKPALTVMATPHGWQVKGLARRPRRRFTWQTLSVVARELVVRSGTVMVDAAARHWVVHDLAAHFETTWRGHSADVTATIPGVCARCSLHMDSAAKTLHLHHFNGALGFDAQALRLQALDSLLPKAARSLRGTLNGRLWTDWRRGALEFAGGDAHLRAAHVPATVRTRVLSIPYLAGEFSFKRNRHGFRFYAAQLTAQGGGVAWRVGALAASQEGHAVRLSAQSLNVQQVAWLLDHVRKLPRSVRPVLARRPRGVLTHLRLQVRRGHRLHYTMAARFHGLGLAGDGRGLQFAHMAGKILMTTHGGRMTLFHWHGAVHGPRVLPGPFVVRDATATVAWQIAANGYSAQIPQFTLTTADGSVAGAAHVVRLKGAAPIVLLEAEVRDVRITALHRYYPKTIKAQTRQWLQRTLRGGVVTAGRVRLEGPLDRFPFIHGGGLFGVDLQVENGRYRFLPTWPTATKIISEVRAHNANLTVRGHGQLGALPVSHLLVRAYPLGTPHGQVAVHFTSHAGLGALLKLVVPHVPPARRPYLPLTMRGHGPAVLRLHIQIPFSRRQRLQMRGQLKLAQARFDYPYRRRWLRGSHLTGQMAFNQRGPTAGHMSGQLLGGPFTLAVGTSGPTTTAHLAGHMSATGVQKLAGRLRPYISGPLRWRLTVIRHAGLVVRGQADLRAVALRLPYPAGKSAGIPATAVWQATARHGTVVFDASLPHHWGGQVIMPDGHRPLRAWLGIGVSHPPAMIAPGLAVAVRSSYLDTTVWQHFLAPIMAQHTTPTMLGRDGSVLPLRTVSLYAGAVGFEGRIFTGVRARIQRRDRVWRAVLTGPDVAGTLRFATRPQRQAQFTFTHLIIPSRRHPAPADRHLLDPRHLPRVVFEAAHVRIGHRNFGHVVLVGGPFADGWRLDEVLLAVAHTTLSGHGRWTLHGGLQETTLALILKSRDLGRTLAAWGYPHQVAGGDAAVHAGLNWPGGPTAFHLRDLEARLQFIAHHGRFLQVREGAGKLLGIFNVDSITRYLTLDFSSLFGRGFSFDQVAGKVFVEDGVASTPGIRVQGTTANVAITGAANLGQQTFDLTVNVNPHLQNNLTLASGLLGGPIAGAAVLLMQKIFAREIDDGTRMTYLIRGPWNKPIIKKRVDLH